MRAVLFFILLAIAFLLLKACADGAARVSEVQRQETHQAEIEEEYARTPQIIPPLDVRPLDPKAQARADKITVAKFCFALGKALRGNDAEFIRAMIKRSADLQLGVLHLDQQNTIKNKQVNLGMTQCMALASWGRPERVNRSVGSYGTHEQWVYPANYIYFEDGILTSFQD